MKKILSLLVILIMILGCTSKPKFYLKKDKGLSLDEEEKPRLDLKEDKELPKLEDSMILC